MSVLIILHRVYLLFEVLALYCFRIPFDSFFFIFNTFDVFKGTEQQYEAYLPKIVLCAFFDFTLITGHVKSQFKILFFISQSVHREKE